MPSNTPPDYVAPDLVIDPADVAKSLGLDWDKMTDDQQWTVEDAIRDAQADVEAYLGRFIMPTEQRVEGQQQGFDGKWDLPEQPVVSIDTITAEYDTEGRATGRSTVDYTAGLNARTDERLRPIRRYVAAAAALSPAVTRLSSTARPITAVNVDGQGITFADTQQRTSSGAPMPGSLPDMASLDRWRLRGRRVFQRRGDNPPVIEPTAWRS